MEQIRQAMQRSTRLGVGVSMLVLFVCYLTHTAVHLVTEHHVPAAQHAHGHGDSHSHEDDHDHGDGHSDHEPHAVSDHDVSFLQSKSVSPDVSFVAVTPLSEFVITPPSINLVKVPEVSESPPGVHPPDPQKPRAPPLA